MPSENLLCKVPRGAVNIGGGGTKSAVFGPHLQISFRSNRLSSTSIHDDVINWQDSGEIQYIYCDFPTSPLSFFPPPSPLARFPTVSLYILCIAPPIQQASPGRI